MIPLEFKDRLKKARRAANLTQEKLAEKVKLKQNTIATYEMGRLTPSDQTISVICNELNIREDWLRSGDGEMYVTKPKDVVINEFMDDVLEDQPESFRRRLIAAMARWTEKDWEDLARLAETLTGGEKEEK
nr:MAG TPA: helix-turn-helix domain protein [Caudoviricetes sp.]